MKHIESAWERWASARDASPDEAARAAFFAGAVAMHELGAGLNEATPMRAIEIAAEVSAEIGDCAPR